ncbi:unnamed protein product [Lactuca virosa]|uniref:Uncharacterized protein n=1 Tax=Lactuca virosa TaxID=75947 RepID=A0AAU9N5P9_9ASTR|nr:unnamed protein product [Lactuca virosa]
MPCFCTGCHASLYHDNTNNWYNNHLLPYQGPPQNPVNYNPQNQNPIFHDQEAMVTNEIDSWLLLNPADQNFNQYQGQFNPQACMQQVNHHGCYGDQQQQQQQMHDFSKVDLDNTPASFFNASLPAIVPEMTPGSYSNTTDWSRVDEFSSLLFHPGNLIEDAVGSNSNSTSLSSEGKQKLDASDKPFKFPPMSRKDRVQRLGLEYGGGLQEGLKRMHSEILLMRKTAVQVDCC